MQTFLIIAVVVLIFLVIFQISKAAEYVSVLKGEENSRKQTNKVNAFMMLGFMILGFVGVWYCNEIYAPKTLMFNGGPASEQGIEVDSMMMWTLAITGIVFVLTQIVLFWFAYKYQENETKSVFYFPHNTTMEVIWTAVPAIALAVLVTIGLKNWANFTSEAPDNALKVEVTGKQFGWIFRYPGKDKEFGKKYYRLIDAADNSLGLIWRDTTITKPNGDKQTFKADKYTHDDLVMEQTMYVVKGRPVKLIINSRDVIHDVGLVHFRMKMDAVPGMPTTLWFTPIYTTAEMKERTKNPNFQYEISCDQMCGNGHYSMKGNIEVVTQAEFDAWEAKQTAKYASLYAPKKEEAAPAGAVKDTAAKAMVAMATKVGK
jgi:cytochrome c oxidase subunit II